MQLSQQERLKIYFERLHDAPPAQSAQEAIDLLNETLEQVEDEFSGILKNPIPSIDVNDGRMYPVQSDLIKPNPDAAGGYILLTRGHRIFIGADGSIRITIRKGENAGQVIFNKPGASNDPSN